MKTSAKFILGRVIMLLSNISFDYLSEYLKKYVFNIFSEFFLFIKIQLQNYN
jgi:hypothetical protein